MSVKLVAGSSTCDILVRPASDAKSVKPILLNFGLDSKFGVALQDFVVCSWKLFGVLRFPIEFS